MSLPETHHVTYISVADPTMKDAQRQWESIKASLSSRSFYFDTELDMVSAGQSSQSDKVPKFCEKKIKVAEIKLNKIINKIDNLKLNSSYVSNLELPVIKKKISSKYSNGVLICVLISGFVWIYSNVSTSGCILEVPSYAKSLFRAPEDCSMCIGVDNITRLSGVSAEEFEDNYAYTTIPVIVTDATTDWRAMKEFNFQFFSKFYRYGKMGKKTNDCFYFAYMSGLSSLDEVFNMDEKRANLSGDPWYVGWSTCYDEETRNLRSYYNRPYFLPRTAESDMVDWIFMGGPGQGAHMHVDSVRHMSWQAQIRGRKQWELAPPPECLYQCTWIKFTVEPGEILVVDTNRWYHRTSVRPGDISITIGAEYD